MRIKMQIRREKFYLPHVAVRGRVLIGEETVGRRGLHSVSRDVDGDQLVEEVRRTLERSILSNMLGLVECFYSGWRYEDKNLRSIWRFVVITAVVSKKWTT